MVGGLGQARPDLDSDLTGVSNKRAAHADLWLRRIAPTTELRTWYGHDVDKWPEFQKRYREELSSHQDLLGLIRDIERHRKVVTLLFGAKDEAHNEADVLLDVLKGEAALRDR